MLVLQGGTPCTGCTSCGVLTAATGTVTDGPSNYPSNALCEWKIIPTGARTVTITFSSFSTESGYDFVQIWECGTSQCDTGYKLDQISGDYSSSLSYTSNTGYMFVRFTSDTSVEKAGFVSTYTSSTQTATPAPTPVCVQALCM
jgi:hypothetical protein